MHGDRVRSECWVHGNFDGSYGKAISQLVARLLHSRHFRSCRSPHCLPVFNRNVSFLSFLAGDRNGKIADPPSHNELDQRQDQRVCHHQKTPLAISGVLRRPATSSFLNFFDSEPACFLTSFHVIKKTGYFSFIVR